jgi:hypothetical protein
MYSVNQNSGKEKILLILGLDLILLNRSDLPVVSIQSRPTRKQHRSFPDLPNDGVSNGPICRPNPADTNSPRGIAMFATTGDESERGAVHCLLSSAIHSEMGFAL